MHGAIARLPRRKRRAKAQQLGRLSWKNRQPSELDEETIRKRALFDRKGTLIREGTTYRGTGTITH